MIPDSVWLFDHTLPSERSIHSYIISRSDFQAKNLKEIFNNYYHNLLGYHTHALSIRTAVDRNSIAIFYSLLSNRRGLSIYGSENICKCHCRVCQQIIL